MSGKVLTLFSLQDGSLLQCKNSDCCSVSGMVLTLFSLQGSRKTNYFKFKDQLESVPLAEEQKPTRVQKAYR